MKRRSDIWTPILTSKKTFKHASIRFWKKKWNAMYLLDIRVSIWYLQVHAQLLRLSRMGLQIDMKLDRYECNFLPVKVLTHRNVNMWLNYSYCTYQQDEIDIDINAFNANGMELLYNISMFRLIPVLELSFVPPQIVLVRVKGYAELQSGELRGLSTLHRSGNVILSADSASGDMKLDASLGINNLQVKYKWVLNKNSFLQMQVLLINANIRLHRFMQCREMA